MVGSSGLEPPTSRLSGVRSNHLSYEPILIRPAVVRFIPSPFGGDEEDRTPDPLRARQVLSQLSYTPTYYESALLAVRSAFASLIYHLKAAPSKMNNESNDCNFPCLTRVPSLISCWRSP